MPGMLSSMLYRRLHPRLFQRTLFTAESVGLDKYESMSAFVQKNLDVPRTKSFWDSFHAIVSNPSTSGQLILSEDVKTALLLIDEHKLNVIQDVLQVYQTQCDRLKLHPLNWQPLLFSGFYKMKLTDQALKMLEDDKNGRFNLQCYVIAADLLFESERYDDVIRVNQIYTESIKSDGDVKFPLTLQILTAASYYKMATEESFSHLIKFVGDLIEKGIRIHPKIITFLAAAAYTLRKNSYGYEYLHLVQDQSNTPALRSLRILLQCRLKKFDEALNNLELVLLDSAHLEIYNSCSVSRETIITLEKGLKVNKHNEGLEKLKRLSKLLEQGGQIIDKTIDQLVCTPIALVRSPILDAVEQEQEPVSMLESSNPYFKVGDELSSLQSFVQSEKQQLDQDKQHILKEAAESLKKYGPLEEENYDDSKISLYEDFVKKGLMR